MEREGREKFEDIEHVGNVVWHLALHQWRVRTALVALAFVVLLGVVVLFGRYVLLYAPLLFGVAVLPFLLYCRLLQREARKWFMWQFAIAKGLQFEREIPVDKRSGALFEMGHTRRIYNVVSGTYNDLPMRLFHYQYNIGYGRNQRAYRFTVFEVVFEGIAFPHILLQSARSFAQRYGKKQKGEREIPLEEEFKKDFRLYTIEGYEIEVLQIFTPETLRFLREQQRLPCSIEFSGNQMYLYDPYIVSNKKDLYALYDAARKIFENAEPLFQRLGKDFAALHPYYWNAKQ